MYLITIDDNIHEYGTRAEAVQVAKSVSAERGGRIIMTDQSGREVLTYRAGTLDQYVYETRAQRRKPERTDRDNDTRDGDRDRGRDGDGERSAPAPAAEAAPTPAPAPPEETN